MKKILFTTILVAGLFADTVHYDVREESKTVFKPNHPIVGVDISGIKVNLPSSN